MSFDPKIIPPDDGSAPRLPDDLAALGDRLRDEAGRLAAHYRGEPMDERVAAILDHRQTAAASPARRAPVVRILLAAAAACVACAVISVWAFRHDAADTASNRPAETPAGAERALRPTPPAPGALAERAADRPPRHVSEAALPISPRPVVTPAVFVPDVTGPELEAVLDLLEDGSGNDFSLSL